MTPEVPRSVSQLPSCDVWRKSAIVEPYSRPRPAYYVPIALPHAGSKALLDACETYFIDSPAYTEFDLLKTSFSAVYSDEGHEHLFFTQVRQYVLDYGATGLSILDKHFTKEEVLPTAKYYFACLLGHIDDNPTNDLRRQYLNSYVESGDPGLQAGAKDALDFMQLI